MTCGEIFRHYLALVIFDLDNSLIVTPSVAEGSSVGLNAQHIKGYKLTHFDNLLAAHNIKDIPTPIGHYKLPLRLTFIAQLK